MKIIDNGDFGFSSVPEKRGNHWKVLLTPVNQSGRSGKWFSKRSLLRSIRELNGRSVSGCVDQYPFLKRIGTRMSKYARWQETATIRKDEVGLAINNPRLETHMVNGRRQEFIVGNVKPAGPRGEAMERILSSGEDCHFSIRALARVYYLPDGRRHDVGKIITWDHHPKAIFSKT